MVLSVSGSGYSDPKLLQFRVQGLCEEDKRDSLMVGQCTPACPGLSLARRAQVSVSGCCPWLYLNVPGGGGAPPSECGRKSQQQVIPEGLESSCETRSPHQGAELQPFPTCVWKPSWHKGLAFGSRCFMDSSHIPVLGSGGYASGMI